MGKNKNNYVVWSTRIKKQTSNNFKKIDFQVKRTLLSSLVSFEEGGHSNSNLDWADEIIISPGIANDSSLVKKIDDFGIPIISEIEFAFRYTKAKIAAITGTNGKTSIATMLRYIWGAKYSGLIGTIENSYGYHKIKSVLTTPDTSELNKLIKQTTYFVHTLQRR